MDCAARMKGALPETSGQSLFSLLIPLKNKFKEIVGVIDVQKMEALKWKINFAQENDIRQAIMQLAVSNNLTILSMKIEEQSLEDIFQKLTI